MTSRGLIAGAPAGYGAHMGWKTPLTFLAIVVLALLVWMNANDSIVPATAPDSPTAGESPGDQASELRPSRSDTATPAATETKRAEHPVTTGSWVLAGATKLGWRQPLPRAKLEITVYSGYQAQGAPLHSLTTESNAEGHFSVATQPPNGTVTIVARPAIENARRTSDQRVVVFGQSPPADLSVSIFPLDRKLSGQVVDTKRKGLAGARVQIRSRSEVLVCDADGHFEAKVSSAERLSLQTAAAGFALTRTQVPMPKVGNPGPVQIELQPGLTVRGRVVDERGEPVAGADVTTFFTSFFAHQTTDTDGRFVLDYLQRARRSHSLFARHEGYIEARADVNTGDVKDSYELVMERGVRVEGSVIDAHGKPVPGAPLYIGFDPGAYSRLDARADDGGRFVFATVEPGRHDLVVEVRGHAPRKMELVVPETIATMPGVIVQLDAAHFVAGTVVDTAGKPLDGVHAHARLSSKHDRNGRYVGESVTCKADGSFRLEDLPSGTVDIEFYGKNIIRHVEKSVRVDQSSAQITLQRAAKLAGKVIDAVSKLPLQKFRIKIIEGRGGGYGASWLRGHDLAASDGRWRSDNAQFKPGTDFVVEAAAKGYGRVLKRMKATLEADPDATVFDLSPGQTVRGQVRAQDSGLPVKGARVIMFADLDPIRDYSARNLETRLTATTDADGRFVLRDAPLGRISLAIQHPEFPKRNDGPFEIVAGIPTERSILLARSARITGIIVDNGDRPIAGARLELALSNTGSGDHFSRTTTSDVNGRCLFEQGLPPGNYQLNRRDDGSGKPLIASRATFELEGGEQRQLRMTPLGKCSVIGTVRSAEGETLPKQVTVFCSRRKGGELVDVRCKVVKGRFELHGLPAGELELRASAWARTGWWNSDQKKVQLNPGQPTTVELIVSKRSP